MNKKIFYTIFLILLLTIALTACKPKVNEKDVKYSDIYVSNGVITPYSEAVLSVTLPDGISPYYKENSNKAKDYSKAYVEDYNLLICIKTVEEVNYMGIYSLDKNKFLGTGCDYTEWGIEYGFVLVRTSDNRALIMDTDGNEIYCANPDWSNGSITSVNDWLIPLSENYFAEYSNTDFYKIFNAKGEVLNKADGTPWTINCDSKSQLKAVDNYIIKTRYSGTGISKKVSDVKIYDVNTRSEIYDVFKDRGSFASSMIRAVFYLGDGKFYCRQTETSDSTAYQYTVNDKYYKVVLWTYDAVNGKQTILPPDLIFETIINEYYSVELSKDVSAYIKKGYSYVSVAYDRNEDKTVNIEQFIIDSDLNVLVSMVSHRGTATTYDHLNDGFRDVLLTYVGDIGFSNEVKGDLMVYDNIGNTIFKKEGVFSEAFYNSGIVVAKQTFTEGDTTESYYAAFNIDSTPVFDAYSRKYLSLSAYVGQYALARDSSGKVLLVDKKGIETPVNDLYISTNGSKVTMFYKAGVYVSYITNGKTKLFGLKSYDGNQLLSNIYSKVIIDKRGTNTVLFYTENADGKWSLYFVK